MIGYSSKQEQGETGLVTEREFVGSELHGNIQNKIGSNDSTCYTTIRIETESPKEAAAQETNHMFQCPETGCVKSYKTHGALENHILLGKHELRLERKSTFDEIKLRWAEVCSDISKEVHDYLEASCNVGDPKLERGWGLKKDKKVVRFSTDVKEFLTEIFNVGEITGEKVTPSDAAMKIRQARHEDGSKRFNVMQYLHAAQITSFFSRLTVSRRKQVPQANNMEDEDLEAALASIEDQNIRDLAFEN